MKDSSEVISDFNEYVNMTAKDLESWLKSDDSNSAGWPKEGADGESVGHDSGRKIVEILKSNPQKNPDKYTDDQIAHMRKVVAYCKRHIAQEKGPNSQKSPEEVKKTKSYASLKNWGHDPLKADGRDGGSSKSKNKKEEEDEVEEEEDEQDDNEEEQEEEEEEPSAGAKRKTRSQQNGANKKRETRKGAATKKSKKDEDDEDVEMDGEDDDEEEDEEDYEEDDNEEDDDGDDAQEEEEDDDEDDNKGAKKGQQNGGSKQAKKGPKRGDKVSWNWGGGQPEGKVLDVKGEETEITTKRGNKVSRKGKPDDPAVVLDTGKSKAIKSNHELN